MDQIKVKKKYTRPLLMSHKPLHLETENAAINRVNNTKVTDEINDDSLSLTNGLPQKIQRKNRGYR